MTAKWLGVAVLGAAVALPAAVSAQQNSRDRRDYYQRDNRGPRETENVSRTVAFPDKGTLRLNNFSGDVRISATTGREVVIKAVRRGTREQLDNIKLEVETSGSTVTIDANVASQAWRDRNRRQYDNDGDVVDTEFDIQVPASARLDIDVFSADVDVRGVSGDQRIKTFSGEITADLTPAGATPNFDGETFSGGIRVRIADGVKSGVRFDSFSGDLDSDLPVTMRSASNYGWNNRGSRSSSVSSSGSSDSTLRFHTFSGNVRITK